MRRLCHALCRLRLLDDHFLQCNRVALRQIHDRKNLAQQILVTVVEHDLFFFVAAALHTQLVDGSRWPFRVAVVERRPVRYDLNLLFRKPWRGAPDLHACGTRACRPLHRQHCCRSVRELRLLVWAYLLQRFEGCSHRLKLLGQLLGVSVDRPIMKIGHVLRLHH